MFAFPKSTEASTSNSTLSANELPITTNIFTVNASSSATGTSILEGHKSAFCTNGINSSTATESDIGSIRTATESDIGSNRTAAFGAVINDLSRSSKSLFDFGAPKPFSFGVSTTGPSSTRGCKKSSRKDISKFQPKLFFTNVNKFNFNQLDTTSEFSNFLIMECASCDICFEDFSDKKIPVVLECGHSLCSSCLGTMLRISSSCHKCRKPLTKSSVEDFPTNFALLHAADIMKNIYKRDSLAVCSLKSLKRVLVSRRESLEKLIEDNTTLKDTLSSDIERIGQHLDMDSNVFNFNDRMNLIKEISDDIKEVENVLHHHESCLEPTISVSQYKNAKQFLCDLSIRLHKGEVIFACEMVAGKVKYGRVTFDDDKINVHVLSSLLIETDASVVLLRDLKKCVTKENFFIFMEFGPQIFLFSPDDSTALVSQFIKLCTGELGPTYQGSAVTRSENPKSVFIRKYMVNSAKSEGNIDYDLSFYANDTNLRHFEIGRVVVKIFANGECQIQKSSITCRSFQNVVAVLSQNCMSDIELISPSLVTDCGISFML